MLQNELQHAQRILSIFLLRKIEIYDFVIFDMFVSQTRYDIDPPHTAVYIECVSTYRTPQAYIEDPVRDLYRGAVAFATAPLYMLIRTDSLHSAILPELC